MRFVLSLTAMLALASAGAAQDRLQPDFTFKRVRPPQAGHTGPRITVQIAPTAPAPAAAADPSAPVTASPGGGWFWGVVPFEADVNGAQRLQTALRVMQTAPQAQSVPAPRLQSLQDVATTHARSLLSNSIETGVSPALALAVIAVESGGRADVTSGAGAQGLMQLIPATADRFGVTDAMDPEQNIRGGMAYLGWLLDHFEGDVILALAGYNAGEGAVRDAGGVPDYTETRAYIPKVLAAWQVARGLCQTPPQLMTDGCVFVTR